MIHLAYVSSVTLSFSMTVKKRKRKGEKEKKESRARSCHSNYRLPPSPLEFDSRVKTIPELRIFSRNRDFPSKVIEMLLLLESENLVVEERGGGGEKAKNLNFWARGPRLQSGGEFLVKADERRRLPDERGEYIDCVSFLVTSQRTRPAYSSPVFVFFPPVFTVSRVDGCPSPPPSPPGEPRNSRDQGFSRAKPSCASKEEEGSREEEEVEEEERE